ncbi:hypothetical protein HDF26_003302 [Pedobacter cryoconitis]|uniref:JmjC domain-containing protein n=1 Tax=Pedobacter cryoconitis TaxID=188932 RepID=A0A7W8ZLW0_9SPHI|nr:hypothetical protein [Pedobacter cryoconitis]MBB5636240.1 hypothetical protein [Pedobacter cryoconitis]MBB6272842.1 hypothetical protein [Pedobacter cryoconitis]
MKNTVFNEQWWDNFSNENKDFTETCVVKNVLSKDLIDLLNKEIADSLVNRFEKKDRAGFRVFFPKEGKGMVNREFINFLYENPPLEDENIVEYCERSFTDKFGLIVNSVEKYSDNIAVRLRDIVAPLLEKNGIPVCGMHVTVFIGNYGWTPLGIHQDDKGANVIHFHLGPGNKTMYTWDQEKYKELTGLKHNNHDIAPLLPHADKHEFGAGDLFYMPWNKFHIGFSDELSVGLTFWFVNPSKTIFLDKVINTFFNKCLDAGKDDVIVAQKDFLNNEESFNDLLSGLKIDETTLQGSLQGFLKKIYDEYKYSIYSNGGWESPTITKEINSGYDIDEYEHLIGKSIKIINHFSIVHEYDGKSEEFSIYVRGIKMEMRYHPELIRIIEKLNTFESQNVKDLLAGLSKEWPEEIGLYFLSLIYDKNGFEIGEQQHLVMD